MSERPQVDVELHFGRGTGVAVSPTKGVDIIAALLLRSVWERLAGRASSTPPLASPRFEAILNERRDKISLCMRPVLSGLHNDSHKTDERIDRIAKEVKEVGRSKENCRRITSIPGVGPMTCAASGKGEASERGRDFASLGRPGAAAVQHGRAHDPRPYHHAEQLGSTNAAGLGHADHHYPSAPMAQLQLRHLAARSCRRRARQQSRHSAGQ